MLVHFFWLEKKWPRGTDRLFAAPGSNRLPSVNWAGITSLVLGVFATWLFMYGLVPQMQGPIATALGGWDLSWLAGGLTSAASYALLGPELTKGPTLTRIARRTEGAAKLSTSSAQTPCPRRRVRTVGPSRVSAAQRRWRPPRHRRQQAATRGRPARVRRCPRQECPGFGMWLWLERPEPGMPAGEDAAGEDTVEGEVAGGAATKMSLTAPMMNRSPGTRVFTTRVEVSSVVETHPAETLLPAPKKIA